VGDKTEFEFSRCEPLMERIRGLQGKQTPETSTSQPLKRADITNQPKLA